MEKIALEKDKIITAIKTGLQEHYDILKDHDIDDENIDTLLHLLTASIMEQIEDQFLKFPEGGI